jgi:hypothetical protein
MRADRPQPPKVPNNVRPVRDSVRRVISEVRGTAAADEPLADFVRCRPHLRASVTDYVGTLRTGGVPVERTIEKVRWIVREVEAGEGWADETDAVMTHVVRWSIEAYYDDPALRGVPRFF